MIKNNEHTQNDPLAQKEELLTLLENLCRIPAPSGQEDHRAAFIRDWLDRECGLSAIIDEAKNVLVFFGEADSAPCQCTANFAPSCSHISSYTSSCTDTSGHSLSRPQTPGSGSGTPSDAGMRDTILFMAHTDTVFPDTSPMPVLRTETEIHSPGVGDDTACAAILMIYLKNHKQELQSCRKPLLFAFNSCEEGLGNLKGCRQIMKDYGERICAVTSFDGGVDGICNHAVGSLRYQVTICTEGGHSYNDFGKENAIEAMAELIRRICQMTVPETGRSTYNVGTITGGTSVNTIAQSCCCLLEYRSDIKANLEQMDNYFHRTLETLKKERPRIRLTIKLVGERPCTGAVDSDDLQALTDRAENSIKKITGKAPHIGSGSTDCNIPLSLGIPAVCFGGLIGGGVHTREEYVSIPALMQEASIIEDYIGNTISQGKTYNSIHPGISRNVEASSAQISQGKNL